MFGKRAYSSFVEGGRRQAGSQAVRQKRKKGTKKKGRKRYLDARNLALRELIGRFWDSTIFYFFSLLLLPPIIVTVGKYEIQFVPSGGHGGFLVVVGEGIIIITIVLLFFSFSFSFIFFYFL